VPETVLIVEDERLIREVMMLEFEDAGYTVLTAQDDRSALAHLTGPEPIDLLFTDIRFPGELNGWMVAKRAAELRPGLPVIYATGYTDELPPGIVPGQLFRKPYRPTQVIEAARAFRRK